MSMRHSTLTVREVQRHTDRTVIYGLRKDYRVLGDKDAVVAVGDVITYERAGCDFGWLVVPLDEGSCD